MAGEAKLISLTADIVAAHVANNSLSVNDLPGLISNIHTALVGLGAPTAQPEPEKPQGAVSIRASIKPDYLVSMIDGKHYKMLRRHLHGNGYTPDSYREAFGLPREYPMVCASYAEQRRTLAKKIGLGRKPKAVSVAKAASPKPRSRAKP